MQKGTLQKFLVYIYFQLFQINKNLGSLFGPLGLVPSSNLIRSIQNKDLKVLSTHSRIRIFWPKTEMDVLNQILENTRNKISILIIWFLILTPCGQKIRRMSVLGHFRVKNETNWMIFGHESRFWMKIY